jgi:hypothetical protein
MNSFAIKVSSTLKHNHNYTTCTSQTVKIHGFHCPSATCALASIHDLACLCANQLFFMQPNEVKIPVYTRHFANAEMIQSNQKRVTGMIRLSFKPQSFRQLAVTKTVCQYDVQPTLRLTSNLAGLDSGATDVRC